MAVRYGLDARYTVQMLEEAEWNVVAEYNGQRCRFQMVPMEELQLFLKLLKGEYYDKATRVLEKVVNTKRKAFFVDNDSANEIIVKDVEKED